MLGIVCMAHLWCIEQTTVTINLDSGNQDCAGTPVRQNDLLPLSVRDKLSQ
jgi:hypothetical protein